MQSTSVAVLSLIDFNPHTLHEIYGKSIIDHRQMAYGFALANAGCTSVDCFQIY